MELEQLKGKYQGSVANSYESRRNKTKKWYNEQKTVENYIQIITKKNLKNILDIPVGTGRFVELYRKYNLNVLGLDVSEGMLKQAKQKIRPNDTIRLEKNDIFHLQITDFNPEVIISLRFFNWLSLEDSRKALQNLASLQPHYMIIGVRTQKSFVKRLDEALIDTPSNGLFDLARSTKIELLKSWGVKKTAITVHDEEKFLELFENIDFEIEQKTLIHSLPLKRQYHIYLLSNNS